MDRHGFLMHSLALLREIRINCSLCNELVGEVIGVLDILWKQEIYHTVERDGAAAEKLLTFRSRIMQDMVTAETVEASQIITVKIVGLIIKWLMCEILQASCADDRPGELLEKLNLMGSSKDQAVAEGT